MIFFLYACSNDLNFHFVWDLHLTLNTDNNKQVTMRCYLWDNNNIHSFLRHPLNLSVCMFLRCEWRTYWKCWSCLRCIKQTTPWTNWIPSCLRNVQWCRRTNKNRTTVGRKVIWHVCFIKNRRIDRSRIRPQLSINVFVFAFVILKDFV